MSWFKGSSGKYSKEPSETAREAVELLDPYSEQTMSARDGQVVAVPGKILENLAQRMERIDLDPATSWAVEDLITEDELSVMFVQLCMGEMFVTETAWFARRILARWPATMVEHPIAECHHSRNSPGLNSRNSPGVWPVVWFYWVWSACVESTGRGRLRGR